MEQAADAAGLSPVAAWALIQLDPHQPLPQKDPAARLHRNPSSVVDTMDRLEKAKLVIRSPNREDRRVKVLVVTSKGARVRRNLIKQVVEPPGAFTTLPTSDQIRLRDLMQAALAGAGAKSGRSHTLRHLSQMANQVRERSDRRNAITLATTTSLGPATSPARSARNSGHRRGRQ